jgi:bifunctional DNA-binding transcriptional regulator/antitoxin component of YhaV-PrlF toxin-antitoxin module
MSRRIEVELDDQGRLVVPHLLQEQLGLFTGATLIVEHETAHAAHVRVKTMQPRLVDKGGVLVVQAEPSGNLADAVRHEREQRIDDLLRRANM